jgi:transcriptional regulator with XRE-family HTH domain
MEQGRPKRRPPKDPLDHAPEAVTQAREQAGLTKTQLALATGVSLSLISEIEHGSRNARPPLIESMARVLDCTPDQLRRKDGQPGTRLAVVCAQCSELWEPDHVCPSERTAGLQPSGANGAAALENELGPPGERRASRTTASRSVANGRERTTAR